MIESPSIIVPPRILRRRYHELAMPTPRCQVGGLYKFQVRRPDGRIRLDTGWFPNLVTDGGLDRLATESISTYCQVGTGNTTPDVNDSSLANHLASTSLLSSNTSGNQSSSPYYAWGTKTFRFNAGVATGNISEVGVGWASTGSLYSRALILDGGGSPTTITVLSDEVLDVTYQNRNYPPEVDGSFNVVDSITGITHAVVARAALVTGGNWSPLEVLNATFGGNVYNGSLGAITGSPSGSSKSFNSSATQPYSSSSYERSFTPSLSLSEGNLSGGISAMRVFGPDVVFQFSFSPAIAKTDEKTLALTWKFGWARKTL